MGLTRFQEETIDTVLGIFLVNDFEVDMEQHEEEFRTKGVSPVRGLYSLASLPNHSCLANTAHTFHPDNLKMTVRAVADIAEGEDITHCYTEPLEPLLTRLEVTL